MTITPTDRATAVFDPEFDSELHCSHCGAAVTDADPECPTCESPIDWAASAEALRTWQLKERASWQADDLGAPWALVLRHLCHEGFERGLIRDEVGRR